MELIQLKQNLEKSGLFDQEWYLATYPDVSYTNLKPLEHFIKYGAMLGRDPGPKFNTEFYLAKYPDVARSDLNPLQHYLLHGINEGRLSETSDDITDHIKLTPKPIIADNFYIEKDMHATEIGLYPEPNYEKAGYNLEQYPANSCLTLPISSGGSSLFSHQPDVGIHLHLHYTELLDEFIEFLSNIDFDFSLYVSVTNDQLVSPTRERLQQMLPRSKPTVRSFPNKGRDIAPFVCGFGQQLLSHEIIAHIHSKN